MSIKKLILVLSLFVISLPSSIYANDDDLESLEEGVAQERSEEDNPPFFTAPRAVILGLAAVGIVIGVKIGTTTYHQDNFATLLQLDFPCGHLCTNGTQGYYVIEERHDGDFFKFFTCAQGNDDFSGYTEGAPPHNKNMLPTSYRGLPVCDPEAISELPELVNISELIKEKTNEKLKLEKEKEEVLDHESEKFKLIVKKIEDLELEINLLEEVKSEDGPS